MLESDIQSPTFLVIIVSHQKQRTVLISQPTVWDFLSNQKCGSIGFAECHLRIASKMAFKPVGSSVKSKKPLIGRMDAAIVMAE